MSGHTTGIGVAGKAPRAGQPMRAGWGQWVHNSIKNLSGQQTGIIPRVVVGKGGGNRFRFGGIFKDKDDKWRVRISEGCIVYREIFLRGDFVSQKSRAQYCHPVFPTVEYNGDDVRIDDPSKPALELGDRDAATVWLVARKDKCNSSSFADGRIIISDRDEDPDIESSEDAIEIVSFDVEETDGGGKKATEVYKFLQSDHHQGYICDKGDDSSDSWDGSDMDGSSDFAPESSSGMIDSTPSGSSDSDDDGDGNAACDVTVTAGWENIVNCLPARPGVKCVADSYDFRIRVRFNFTQPFGGKVCQGIAYAASLEGGVLINPGISDTSTEYRWRDDQDRTLTWRVAQPPACGYLRLSWRMKTFPAVPDFGEEVAEEQGCCGLTYSSEKTGPVLVILREYTSTGRWDPSKTKLPPVCGCTCSSSATEPESSGGGEGGGA